MYPNSPVARVMIRFRSVVVVIGVVVASACEPEVAGSSKGRANTEITTTTSVSTLVEQQTRQVEQTTTIVSVADELDPRLHDRCVELVEFQAYVGDADALAMWERAGQSHEVLTQECQILDEATLQEMSDEMDRIDTELAALTTTSTTTTSTATTTTTTTTPPTTAPPPPPAPPSTPQVVVAPPPPATTGSCDPNYTGCVPIDSDVDCAGGSGNGPSYAHRPVQVIGSDIYGLDRDGDGVGCE